jgi:starvation-inducible DNA-binding protein
MHRRPELIRAMSIVTKAIRAEMPATLKMRNLGTTRLQLETTMKAQNLDFAMPKVASAPSGFDADAVTTISTALNAVLADLFSLYVKTKNFHWHVSGPHFRDYHLLLDEQADRILATTDAMAERVRKIGGETIHSIGQIARLQGIPDNDEQDVPARRMLAELCKDNSQLAIRLRAAHFLCDEHGDVASASVIENWIDEAEHRVWFLYEATREQI